MARLRQTFSETVKAAGWRAFGVPIYVKILGIGLVVTLLFGILTFYQIEFGIYRTHRQVYGETVLSLATSFATRIEGLVRAGDIAAIDSEVNLMMASFVDLRYVMVQGPDGNILSHGFTFP